ncbi:MAG: CPBP family intramembrane metalloprotease, partial [Anaerolineaceae bacterium]|nr:CPBP family intramembrane metalloprotease [Anaerolineaceae bacterium]
MLLRLFWNPEEKRLAMVWRLIIQLILMFVLALPLGFLQFYLLQSEMQPAPGMLIALNLLSVLTTLLGFMGSIWLTGRLFGRRKFTDFGIHFSRNWWTDLGFGMLLGAVLMALIFLVEYAAGWITITDIFHDPNSQYPFWVGFLLQLLFFVNVGIYEEFFSRGFHLKNLSEGFNVFKRINPQTAILISLLLSSAFFGLLHAGNPNATWVSSFNIFLAGIFLAMGFILTGELAIPIGVHITWNFFQGNVFGFPVSGTNAGATLIAIEQKGSQLFTGGPFGPEAGLIGIAAIILGSVLTVLYVKMRYGKATLFSNLAVPEFLSKHQAKLDAA